MNSNILITIEETTIDNTLVQTVNARELHTFLGVGDHFRTWITRRIEEYNFVENQDFTFAAQIGAANKGRGGHNKKEYHITIDMAKELSMVERNAKGKEARQYFIQCEKDLNTPTMQGSLSEAQIVEEGVIAVKASTSILNPDDKTKIQMLRVWGESRGVDMAFLPDRIDNSTAQAVPPKHSIDFRTHHSTPSNVTEYTHEGYITIREHCKTLDIKYTKRMSQRAVTICREQGIVVGRGPDDRFKEGVNAFPLDVVEEAVSATWILPWN